jgi:HK97 family phage portal protein
MGLLAEKLHLYALSPENPAVPLGSWGILAESFGLNATDAGVVVNERLAMHLSVVQACVRVIAETIASAPLHVYEKIPGGQRIADQHRLYPLLHDAPNDEMSSYNFRETGQAYLSLWGNTYYEIQRDRAGRAVAFWPHPSDRIKPVRSDGVLAYATNYTPTGTERIIKAKDMLHIPGLAYDGILGISPIATARQAVGLAMATERFGAQFFGNGSRPGGVLTAPGVMTDDQKKRNRESWQTLYGGSNAHRVAVLDGGLTFTPIGIPPEDAQFLETRKFQVADIARLFRVPLHMIGELERSTNNNIEHQSIEFVQNTIEPIAARWKAEFNRKLFSGTNFFADFDLTGLLRGDFKSRQEGLAIMRQNGIVNTDEWRQEEGYNPIGEEEGGEKYIVQLNMQALEKVGEDLVAEPGESTDEPPAQTQEKPANKAAALLPVFCDAIRRNSHYDKPKAKVFEAAIGALVLLLGYQEDREFIVKYCEQTAEFAIGWAKDQSLDIEATAEAEIARAVEAIRSHYEN